MHRFFHHILLSLLVFGMFGPITTRAWRAVVQTGGLEEEHEVHKDLAVFRNAPRLMARGTVPYKGPRRVHLRFTRARVVNLEAPEQTQRPRAVAVWCPLRLAPDGD